MIEFILENICFFIWAIFMEAIAIGNIIRLELAEKKKDVRCSKCHDVMIRAFSLRGEDRFCNTCGYGIHIQSNLGKLLNVSFPLEIQTPSALSKKGSG